MAESGQFGLFTGKNQLIGHPLYVALIEKCDSSINLLMQHLKGKACFVKRLALGNILSTIVISRSKKMHVMLNVQYNP